MVELNCKLVVSFLLQLSDLQSRLRGATTSNDVLGLEIWKIRLPILNGKHAKHDGISPLPAALFSRKRMHLAHKTRDMSGHTVKEATVCPLMSRVFLGPLQVSVALHELWNVCILYEAALNCTGLK